MTKQSGPWARYESEVVPLILDRWKNLGIYPDDLKTQKGSLRGPCPLHGGDNEQAFDLNPETLQWCCHTGCTPEQGQAHAGGGPIEYLMIRDGIERDEARDRLAEMVGIDIHRKPLKLKILDAEGLADSWSTWCSARHLDRHQLRERWDCHIAAWKRRPAVIYPTPGGERIRYLDMGKRKYEWRSSAGAHPAWYGLPEALSMLAPNGRLYVVNGEPSMWACHQSGVPAICTCGGEGTVPGEDMLRALGGLGPVAIVFDLDPVGQVAGPKWVEALAAVGISAVSLTLPWDLGDHGDVDDLHRKVGDDGLGEALDGLEEMLGGVERVVANFEAGRKDKRIELSQKEIVASVHRATGDWPRAYGSLLFAAEPPPSGQLPGPESIRYLDGSGAEARILTWLRRFARVEWTGKEVEARDRPGKRSPFTKAEFHRALEMDAPYRYQAVELLPHYPPRPSTYYACGDLASGKGKALADFMSLLNPDTELDADLLCAALVTPGWGGEPGCRPGFVLTSNHGVGSGKTATAVAISSVWGGAVRLQPESEDWATTLQRLLSDASLSQRMVLVDNLRGRLASGSIESAITEEVISGKRMYYGEFSRPGTMTWMLTVNVAELSRDLADRCVVIRIGPPCHGVDFRGQVAALLRERRHELVCDCLGYLRSAPRCTIQDANRDRFQAWQDAVLTRLPSGDALAAEIKLRRPAVDADTCEAQDVADALAALLRMRGHCPDHDLVFLPFKDVHELLGEDLGCRSKHALGRRLKQLCQHQPLRSVQPAYRHRYYGTGLLWHPGVASDASIRRLNPESTTTKCAVCNPEMEQERVEW